MGNDLSETDFINSKNNMSFLDSEDDNDNNGRKRKHRNQHKKKKGTQQERQAPIFSFTPSISKIAEIGLPSSINQYVPQKEAQYFYLGKRFILPVKDELYRVSFDEKVLQFKELIHQFKIDWRLGCEIITINREDIINMSMLQFKALNLYKELKINFVGEVNQDAGGLIREWLTCLIKELQKEDLHLFEKAETDEFSLKINSKLEPTERNIQIFNFIGKLLAKALLENLTINTCFNKYIYKIILEEPIEFQDLAFIDHPLYNSLCELKKMEDLNEQELPFIKQYNNEETNEVITEEFITNGENITLTQENFDLYVKCRIMNILHNDYLFINEIKKGLFALIPESVIKIFTSDELELIVNGQPFIDIVDWQTFTVYDGYVTTDELIINFWDIISELTQEQLAKLLQFSTGSSRVPIGGFRSLESNRENKAPFCITRTEYDPNSHSNFIKSHTCFNRLDIPAYPSRDLLAEGLLYIINNEVLGFGIE